MIDQSHSMDDAWGAGEGTRKKSEGVADAINRLLQNLVIRCSKEEGIRDYYHVAVIGYGQDVGPALGGGLEGRALVPISEIGDNPAKLETRTQKEDDGAGGLIEREVRFPIWFDPRASDGTPMCQALAQAQGVIQQFLTQYPGCFPPIVINITDGEATDGDPTNVAKAVREMKSDDGNVLLFNLHVSSQVGAPVLYPDGPQGLADDYAKLLFEMSSVLPDYMRSFALQEGMSVSPNARGFVFNADIVSVISFLDIGTRPSNLR
jgi:hypothetical protein